MSVTESAPKANTDEIVLRLLNDIATRKAEIESLDKPNYQTNRSFPMVEGNNSSAVNLATVRDVGLLVKCLGVVVLNQEACEKAAAQLDIAPPLFKWGGYTAEEWAHDIRVMVAKLQINEKKSKLATLEARANSIISPELRREMELKSIMEAMES